MLSGSTSRLAVVGEYLRVFTNRSLHRYASQNGLSFEAVEERHALGDEFLSSECNANTFLSFLEEIHRTRRHFLSGKVDLSRKKGTVDVADVNLLNLYDADLKPEDAGKGRGKKGRKSSDNRELAWYSLPELKRLVSSYVELETLAAGKEGEEGEPLSSDNELTDERG